MNAPIEDRGEPVPPAVAVASLYQENLVTRQTGRVVRHGIEQLISDRGESIAVIDLRDVAVIDFSCADEVVAKLVMGAADPEATSVPRFVLVRGLRDHHLDVVDGALCRRGLAVAAVKENGEPVLLGNIESAAKQVWRAVSEQGRVRIESLARCSGLDVDICGRLLDGLYRRRLIRRVRDAYEPLWLSTEVARDAADRIPRSANDESRPRDE